MAWIINGNLEDLFISTYSRRPFKYTEIIYDCLINSNELNPPPIEFIVLRKFLDGKVQLTIQFHSNINKFIYKELCYNFDSRTYADKYISIVLTNKTPDEIQNYLKTLKSLQDIPENIFNHLNNNINKYVLKADNNLGELNNPHINHDIIISGLKAEGVQDLNLNLKSLLAVTGGLTDILKAPPPVKYETDTLVGEETYSKAEIDITIG